MQISVLHTPYSRFLLEKLTGFQLVKKFPAFYGTQRFITAFTSARHLSLTWASLIQSILSHPTSWRSILILSSHVLLGLPSGLLPSGLPTKALYTPNIVVQNFWLNVLTLMFTLTTKTCDHDFRKPTYLELRKITFLDPSITFQAGSVY